MLDTKHDDLYNNNTMRILFILHEKKLGGASKSVVALINELKSRSHDIYVVSPFASGPVYEAIKNMDIPIKTIFYGWWMMPSYWSRTFKLAFRCLYAFRYIAVNRICHWGIKNNVQLIHSNSSVIDVGALSAKKIGIPHIWHFREYGDIDFSLEFLKGRSRSYSFINSIDGKNVFISNDLYEYYKKDIIPEKSLVIYNGVSESYIQHKDYDDHVDTPVVFLISGTLHKTKRQDIALRACRILLDRNYTFKIILAGSSSAMNESKEYEKELRDFAHEFPDGYVEFTGYTTQMNKYRMISDVELVCSTREAFGRVTVEAMLSGNPVIGADSGATPELIKDGVNGLIYPSGDEYALADKMEIFISHPEYIREMGLNAQKYATKTFMADNNAGNIEDLYKSLLKNQ